MAMLLCSGQAKIRTHVGRISIQGTFLLLNIKPETLDTQICRTRVLLSLPFSEGLGFGGPWLHFVDWAGAALTDQPNTSPSDLTKLPLNGPLNGKSPCYWLSLPPKRLKSHTTVMGSTRGDLGLSSGQDHTQVHKSLVAHWAPLLCPVALNLSGVFTWKTMRTVAVLILQRIA